MTAERLLIRVRRKVADVLDMADRYRNGDRGYICQLPQFDFISRELIASPTRFFDGVPFILVW